jgi:uncharacterized membrane protein
MARALLIGALAWPLLLGAALSARVTAPANVRPGWTAIVYFAAGHMCHQQDGRSFHTHGVKWPVCARCAGLYLAAPLGAWLALGRRRSQRAWLVVLAVAAVPTVVTVGWEWLGGAMPAHWIRFATALPLGTAVAATLVGVTHRID